MAGRVRLMSAGALLRGLAGFAALLLIAPDRGAAIPFGSEDHEHEFAGRKGPRDAFDSIGQIECRDPHPPGNRFYTTGWLIGDNRTVITAAHAFYRTSAAAPRAALKIIDPRSCVFMLFERDWTIRGRYAVRYGMSPWADRKRRHDVSYDVAIVRLDRPVAGAVVPPARAARKFPGTSIRLYAFRSPGKESRLLHESEGIMERFANERERLAVAKGFGLRISHPEVLLLTSANTMQGSSGGMYYASTWRAAIGIHLGHLCLSYRGPGSFNPHNCFNYGRLISRKVLGWVDDVKADTPYQPYLIRTKID